MHRNVQDILSFLRKRPSNHISIFVPQTVSLQPGPFEWSEPQITRMTRIRGFGDGYVCTQTK